MFQFHSQKLIYHHEQRIAEASVKVLIHYPKKKNEKAETIPLAPAKEVNRIIIVKR
jgi:hypothetical protein